MGYIIQGRIEVSIFIDDIEYPLDSVNALNYLHIATTAVQKMPTLSLSITDVEHVMERIGLQDGIPLRVAIKPQNGDMRTYRFRKFNHTRTFNGDAYVFDITGYWDAPLYWNTTSATTMRGASNEVLEQIANKCGILYEGTPTSDVQLWCPQNQSWSAFAIETASAGYVDPTSCMCLVFDRDGTLRYKNLNKLDDSGIKILAYQYAEDAFTAVDIHVVTASGFNNALSGYQNMRYKQSLVLDEVHTQIDQLAFTPDTRSPQYNKALKDKLTRGPVRFGPIDVGNVHPEYEKASYQNMRYKNLFSLHVEALLIQPSSIKLLDKLSIAVQKEDTGQDSANSGTYVVSGHAIYVQGANYSEKVLLSRHGTNENYVDG